MAQKALLVIDMQNDYLWEKRKSKFAYDTANIVKSVNDTIREYSRNGWEIIYILQIFPNIITNRWFIGFSISGTEGAELYKGIDMVSEYCFEKNFPDTFTSKPFREHIKKSGCTEFAICGIDECGCVGETAMGAVKAGFKVKMIKDAIGCRFSNEKLEKKRNKLISLGVEYI